MKKLKLKALELGAMEVLTRAQLKTILGGAGSGSGSGSGSKIDCTGTCTQWDAVHMSTLSAPCKVKTSTFSGKTYDYCGCDLSGGSGCPAN